ncbi:hypothetical protein EGW08_010463, partial [Elysia chlorotica]
TPADGGNYSCQYVSDDETSSTSEALELVVNRPDTPQFESSATVVGLEERVILSCLVSFGGSARVIYTFIQPNKALFTTKDRRITISRFGSSNIGEYKCKISILETESELSNAVWISLKPATPSLSTIRDNLFLNGSTVLFCSNSDTEPPEKQFIFMKNKEVVQEGRDHDVTIQDFSPGKEAQYTCYVEIRNAQNNGTIQSESSNAIQISFAWSSIILTSNLTEVTSGDTVKLTCGSAGLEILREYYFYKDNFLLAKKSTITSEVGIFLASFSKADQGNYSCRWNPVATGERPIWSNDVSLTCVSQFHICECHCPNHIVQVNITSEEVQKVVHELEKDLKMPKMNLSSTHRRKVSVADYNPYSTSVGYVAILMLVLVFGSIVLSDSRGFAMFVYKKVLCCQR